MTNSLFDLNDFSEDTVHRIHVPGFSPMGLANFNDAVQSMTDVFKHLGFDLSNPHLQDTPKRFIRSLIERCSSSGWDFTTFPVEGEPGLILQANIPFVSICSHHLSPFMGTAAVAYIPHERLVGLSKLARVIQTFSTGLHTQEDIGRNSLDFLIDHLQPIGAAVILKAEHTCMSQRGVKAHGSQTLTSNLHGCFKDEAPARAELFQMLRDFQ